MNDVQKAAEGVMFLVEFAFKAFICILLIAIVIAIIEEIQTKFFPTRYDKMVRRQIEEAEKRIQAMEIKNSLDGNGLIDSIEYGV